MPTDCQYPNCSTAADYILHYSEMEDGSDCQPEKEKEIFSCQVHIRPHIVDLKSKSITPYNLTYIPCRDSCRNLLSKLLLEIDSQPVSR